MNPHVRFKMRGAGADGVERLWDIESNSVSIVSRFGLTAEVVAAGDSRQSCGQRRPQADNVLWLTNMLLPRRRGDPVRRAEFGRAGRSRRSAPTSAAPSPPDSQRARHLPRLDERDGSARVLGRQPAAHAERGRRARGVQSDHGRPDRELRAERHAVHHGAAVSDGARGRRRRHPAAHGGVRHRSAHRDVDRGPGVRATTALGELVRAVGRRQRSSSTTTNIDYRWFNGTGIPLGPGAAHRGALHAERRRQPTRRTR